jgi:hypothetical protein
MNTSYILKRTIGSIGLGALLLLGNVNAIAQAQNSSVPNNSYRGDYYNGKLFNEYVLSRNDSNINFSWGTGSPDPAINTEKFSVRWKGNFDFQEGTYQFRARADDGVRIYVGGKLVLDRWTHQQPALNTNNAFIAPAGTKEVVVEYFEASGGASITIDWDYIGQTLTDQSSVTTQTGVAKVSAQTTGSKVPDFPACSDQADDGDWFTSDYGAYKIPTLEDPFYGTNDVYYINDGGNFLQCVCASGTNQGKQINWWKVGNGVLTSEEITAYQRLGWGLENGKDYNLLLTDYLFKSSNYTCSETAPLPTPTAKPKPKAVCSDLTAEPSEGAAPLSVKFDVECIDPDGEIGTYRYDMGYQKDGAQVVFESDKSEFATKFNDKGEYEVKLEVFNKDGEKVDCTNCSLTISANGTPENGGIGGVAQLPQTGAPAVTGLILTSLGGLGFSILKVIKVKEFAIKKIL